MRKDKSFEFGWMKPEDLVIVGVDTPHKVNEHHLYDEQEFERLQAPLDEALVLNIMQAGVKKPIEIEPSGDGKGDYVGEGRRRVLHAREANRRLVAAGEQPIEVPVLRSKKDLEQSLAAMRIGNRFALSDSVVTNAKGARDMLARGIAPEKVAVWYGITLATLDNWKLIAGAPAEWHELIARGALTPTALSKALKKSEDEQIAIYNKAVERLADNETEASIEDRVEGLVDETPQDEAQATERAPASGGQSEGAPAVSPEEGQGTPAEAPQGTEEAKAGPGKKRKKKAKKKASKVTAASIEGKRGKKFYKTFAEDFAPFLPAEFVLGMQFAHGIIVDADLPKGIATQLQGMRFVHGEITEEQLPTASIRAQLKKMYSA